MPEHKQPLSDEALDSLWVDLKGNEDADAFLPNPEPSANPEHGVPGAPVVDGGAGRGGQALHDLILLLKAERIMNDLGFDMDSHVLAAARAKLRQARRAL